MSPQTPQKKILVVDDDESFGVMLREALSDRGYEVVVCFDPLGGAAAMKSFQPDLVITDINMPAGGGQSLFRAVRMNAPMLPVIVASGSVKPDEIWERLGTVADSRTAVMHKPLQIKPLAELVARMLGVSA
ncbi:MAG: response regulator [Elusimicrobiota bacterium]